MKELKELSEERLKELRKIKIGDTWHVFERMPDIDKTEMEDKEQILHDKILPAFFLPTIKQIKDLPTLPNFISDKLMTLLDGYEQALYEALNEYVPDDYENGKPLKEDISGLDLPEAVVKAHNLYRDIGAFKNRLRQEYYAIKK